MSVWGRLRDSGRVAIGDIVFGMEDGAVSVAGLVTGVSASTGDSAVVILAGASGAVAGAVSMMAGRFLDVQSSGDRAQALLAATRKHLSQHPGPHLVRAAERLDEVGYSPAERDVVIGVLQRSPEALLQHVAAFELGVEAQLQASPRVHALWMFVSDLLAASVPVLPFFFLPLEIARLASLLMTGVLMAVLGFARGRIGGTNVWWTAIQTMAIAGGAALAGALIGRVVTLGAALP